MINYSTSYVAVDYLNLLIFVATYQRFDGIVLPNHKVEIPIAKSSSSAKDPAMCNGVKLNSFNYYTRDLSSANHEELRRSGLSMHLQSIHGVLVGADSMNDTVFCVERVCTTYLSLHKYYLCCKGSYGYLTCHDWEFNETTKVWCVQVCMYVRTYVLTTYQ